VKHETRPPQPGPEVKHEVDHSLADAAAANIEDIAAQLRRRRASSYRLPPLACGRRDPLDPRGR